MCLPGEYHGNNPEMSKLLHKAIRWKPLTDVVDGYSPTLPHLKGLQNGDTATSAIKQVITLNFIF